MLQTFRTVQLNETSCLWFRSYQMSLQPMDNAAVTGCRFEARLRSVEVPSIPSP